jgi:hypothetical protein
MSYDGGPSWISDRHQQVQTLCNTYTDYQMNIRIYLPLQCMFSSCLKAYIFKTFSALTHY